jgi:hypothetical protein
MNTTEHKVPNQAWFFSKRVLSHKGGNNQVIDKTFHQIIKYLHLHEIRDYFVEIFYLIFSNRAVRTAGNLSSDTAGLAVAAVFVVVAANEIGDTVVKGVVVVVLR